MNEYRGPEHLNAPWRMEYVAKSGKTKTDGCIFCEKPAQDCDRENGIVHRGEHCYVIMNAYPYNSGHLMIIPYQHVSDLCELPAETTAEMMALAARVVKVFQRALHPDGYNLGMNIGRAGGAGISEHLHMHIVPRWVGDTNFITVIGNVRVLPESLEKTWERLCNTFAEVLAEEPGD